MHHHFKITDFPSPGQAFERARAATAFTPDPVVLEMPNGYGIGVTRDDTVQSCACKHDTACRKSPDLDLRHR